MEKRINDAISIVVTMVLVISVFAPKVAYEVFALENMIQTQGFELSEEFSKAISNEQNSYLDKNNDGFLEIDEAEDLHVLYLDCTDSNIIDWSDLNYFAGLQRLVLYNVDGNKVSFDNISESNRIYSISILNCKNFDKISGITCFPMLNTVCLSTEESLSCKSFENIDNLYTLIVCSPNITDIEALANTNISSLTINSDTLNKIEQFPVMNNLIYLDISGNNISDLSIIENLTELRVLYANNNGIYDASILKELEKLQELELEGNRISNCNWISDLSELNSIMIAGNPLTDTAKIELIKMGLPYDNLIMGKVNSEKYVLGHEYPLCDVIDFSKINLEITDTEVAELDELSIRLKKIGDTTLKVSYEDNIEFSYNVKVTENTIANDDIELPRAESIDIIDSEIYLGYVGTQCKLNTVFLPIGAMNESVTWSSDNESVAEVDSDGNVKCKAVGMAVITAKSENGLSDDITINVNEYTNIPLDETVELSLGSNNVFYRFVPEEDGKYIFSIEKNLGISGLSHISGSVFNNELKQIKYEYGNFDLVCDMVAGNVYYLNLMAQCNKNDSVCFISIKKYEDTNSGEIEGDVDSNGIVNAEDALILLKYSAKIYLPDFVDEYKIDINKDKKINAEDALYVLKIAAKLL